MDVCDAQVAQKVKRGYAIVFRESDLQLPQRVDAACRASPHPHMGLENKQDSRFLLWHLETSGEKEGGLTALNQFSSRPHEWHSEWPRARLSGSRATASQCLQTDFHQSRAKLARSQDASRQSTLHAGIAGSWLHLLRGERQTRLLHL